MFLRVLVLFLGLVGGMSSGVIGFRWMSSASEHTSVIESKRDSSDEDVKKALDRIDSLSRASWLLLLAMPLGIAGGVLAGMGRGKIAAIPLLLAVPGPAIFSLNSLTATIGLLVGGCLAFLIRPSSMPDEVGLKGCWNAVTGWLNIGGVKVSFVDVSPNVPKSGNSIAGKVLLKTRTDRHIVGVHYKLLQKRSTGGGEDKKNKEYVLGETTQPLGRGLAAGESLSLDFRLPYQFDRGLKDMGGVLGGVGKLAAFAVGEKDEFFLIAEAEVPGALFEPSTKLKVKMID